MKKILTFIIIAVMVTLLYIKWQVPTQLLATPATPNIEHDTDQNLILVNQQHPIRQDQLPTDLVNLFEQQRTYTLFSSDIQLRAHVATALQQMINAANTEGVTQFIVMSGYRNLEEQQALYDEMGSSYAMKPGYSEHHTGLALDIGSTEGTMEMAPEGKWVANNAHRFGFVLRYPADKTAITGIEFEPWHLRYVGLPHSERMHEQNLVLEEYTP
ncbi:D-alanyl-D-alanine carboxypeptidase family protein [Lysinibacillus sp. BF-4]|uniref:M15 family metallopeptidase n=1 Tax=Lysinibacillus sp. BF-4 TaxID=1473546 RepID=UPI00068A2F3A|nr:M15 family metallopeptidase [Lysinibacillus sp. BF-4]